MGRLLIWLAVVAVIAGLSGYYWVYDGPTHRAVKKLEQKTRDPLADMRQAQQLLDAGDQREALEIIGLYLAQQDEGHLDQRWIRMAITAYQELGDPLNLMALYRLFPHVFAEHEEGTLVVAWARIHSDVPKSYEEIRDAWRGREQKGDAWWLMDADYLIVTGKYDEAQKMLASRELAGAMEATRLTRLSLLATRNDMQAAWNLLEEALEVDPDNPEVRSRRAELAERAGSLPLAQAEFTAALQLQPHNPLLRSQLAEFYRRHEQYGMAINVWVQGLSSPSVDETWIKALFWSRVVRPAGIHWGDYALPRGRYQHFVKYLVQLSPYKFWDDDAFEQVEEAGQVVAYRQEAFWLRLIDRLQNRREAEALALIESNSYGPSSWHPELELQLRRLLSYRLYGAFYRTDREGLSAAKGADEWYRAYLKPSPLRHQYFRKLNEIADNSSGRGEFVEMSDEFNAFLKGSSAFSAVFLAAGWLETALHLQEDTIVDSSAPEWLAYGLAQALRQNRGTDAALAFATLQRPSPPLNLLMGELLLAVGSAEEGIKVLDGMADEDSDIGFQAAWLLVQRDIQQEDYVDARRRIRRNPRLSKHLLGKEAMARMAMFEDNLDEADRLYGAIVEESTEAKSYLARRAFTEGNYDKARALTEDLLREFPNHPVLNENLRRIRAAQGE